MEVSKNAAYGKDFVIDLWEYIGGNYGVTVFNYARGRKDYLFFYVNPMDTLKNVIEKIKNEGGTI